MTTRCRTDAVAVLRWPEDRAAVESLRRERSTRLLLVSAEEPPPAPSDPEEDWIRLPATAEDINARLSALVCRAGGAGARRVSIDTGRLLVGERWIVLSPDDEAICRALVDRLDDVCGLDALLAAPEGKRFTANSLRVHMTRLRPRLAPLGLTIRTVPRRGYLLEFAEVAEAG